MSEIKKVATAKDLYDELRGALVEKGIPSKRFESLTEPLQDNPAASIARDIHGAMVRAAIESGIYTVPDGESSYDNPPSGDAYDLPLPADVTRIIKQWIADLDVSLLKKAA